jgi:uncharacterized protein with von Willebrand factor type A (vWA) domain
MPGPSTPQLVSLSNHRTSFLEYLSPRRKAEHSLDRLDSFDLQMADRASDVEIARRVVQPAGEAYPPACRLFQDALLGLYKAVPQRKTAEQVTPSHRLNHAVMGRAMQERAFEELRIRTKLDPAMATLGAVNLWEQLMDLLSEEQKEAARQAAEQEEKAAQKEQQAGTAQALAQAATEAGDEEKAGQFQKQAAKLQAQAQKARQKAEATMQAALENAPPDQAVHRAVKQAAEKTDGQAESLDGWGLDPGALRNVPPEERLALAERVMQSDKLRRLAALVGRFCNLAIAAQAERTERAPGQIEGVELGGDVGRMLPAELALLNHPALRRDLYRRLAERQVMQYRMTGRCKQALGPLVVCYDESGSMAGVKELWAKAVVLALLFVARRQGRPFAAIAFGSAKEIRVKTIEQPRRATMADVLEVAEPFFDGGTDFQRPLTEARRIVEAGKGFERADVVFVTDGLCSVTPEFLAGFAAFKRATGTRVFAVLADVGQSAESSVRLWADQVHRVVDLAHDARAAQEAASAVFGAV